MKLCPKCNTTKSNNEFYQTKSRPTGAAYCKECFNKICVERWIQRKIEAINYKGGKCIDCNLMLKNSHYAVFEFHHLNSLEKDADWSKLRLKNIHKINEELDKCVLLCANCHRIRHSK
jgi:hypothetical protein